MVGDQAGRSLADQIRAPDLNGILFLNLVSCLHPTSIPTLYFVRLLSAPISLVVGWPPQKVDVIVVRYRTTRFTLKCRQHSGLYCLTTRVIRYSRSLCCQLSSNLPYTPTPTPTTTYSSMLPASHSPTTFHSRTNSPVDTDRVARERELKSPALPHSGRELVLESGKLAGDEVIWDETRRQITAPNRTCNIDWVIS